MVMAVAGCILWQGAGMTARAEEESPFDITAGAISSGQETYDIELTIENRGADWEGTVRLTVGNGYRDYQNPPAYDTVLSLPQGARKQFVTRVPASSIYNTYNADGTVTVTLLGAGSGEDVQKEFPRLLSEEMDALNMGILSDDYPALTYLDMGGNRIYFADDVLPVRLVELERERLGELLDSLKLLVIDRYDTSTLTDEQTDAIAEWVDGGGVLIIGTGEYAEDTLAGFDGSYGQSGEIHAPGETEDFAADPSWNWSLLTLADLEEPTEMQSDYYTGEKSMSVGDGSVSVLPYSLTGLGRSDDFFAAVEREDFVRQILAYAIDFANPQYTASYNYNTEYMMRDMLKILGNSDSVLNFGALNGIIALYVIFVGPILYLILRLAGKRELYWIAVPVTAVAGIVLIYFAGRGFEVTDARMYSVTIQDPLANGKDKTYLYGYNAGYKEWALKLSEGYGYAGPLGSVYNGRTEPGYCYHIQKDGDSLLIGMQPDMSFDDSFFVAGGKDTKGQDQGLRMDNVVYVWGGFQGTVTNETDQDMPYFAVYGKDTLAVYENLPAGATCDLAAQTPVFREIVWYDSYNSYRYNLVDDLVEEGELVKAGDAAALGVGIFELCPPGWYSGDRIFAIGVERDWEKAIDDDCHEISFGCLYTVQ